MIWVNGLIYEYKKKKKEQWHKWFAWYPVVIRITEDHHEVKAWLQYVERIGRFHSTWDECYWIWNYRELE